MKKRIALIFGGKSAEHEVSIVSAKNIFKGINKKKYNIVLIGITPKGEWIKIKKNLFLSESKKNSINKITKKLGESVFPFTRQGNFFIKTSRRNEKVALVFPIIHGPFGEDGSIQGLLKLYNTPFVGAGILGSAAGMDKEFSKKILRNAKIPVGKFLVIKKANKNEKTFEEIKKELGIPFFIKPASLGSSVGVSKIRNIKEFEKGTCLAFCYDNKIILEKFIEGRELECSVLGNEKPCASVLGEIIPKYDFYSYKAKYLDKKGADLIIPADISKKITKKIQEMAINVYQALDCEGMGRVDFFLTEKNKIYANEINTIPGFTSISMYPKLWEKSGLPYEKLIEKLITLALERHNQEEKLRVALK